MKLIKKKIDEYFSKWNIELPNENLNERLNGYIQQHTFSQIDFLVNINSDERKYIASVDNITGIKKLPDENENIRLCSFSFRNTADIDFAIDNQLADKGFRLIYDDEPDWDYTGISAPCPENEFEITTVKL